MSKNDSLWPSDAIWGQRSGSTLAQVMACCLMATSHYLNQCWLIINGAVWYSPYNNLHKKRMRYQLKCLATHGLISIVWHVKISVFSISAIIFAIWPQFVEITEKKDGTISLTLLAGCRHFVSRLSGVWIRKWRRPAEAMHRPHCMLLESYHTSGRNRP